MSTESIKAKVWEGTLALAEREAKLAKAKVAEWAAKAKAWEILAQEARDAQAAWEWEGTLAAARAALRNKTKYEQENES